MIAAHTQTGCALCLVLICDNLLSTFPAGRPAKLTDFSSLGFFDCEFQREWRRRDRG
jgi:hypothetical protein